MICNGLVFQFFIDRLSFLFSVKFLDFLFLEFKLSYSLAKNFNTVVLLFFPTFADLSIK